MKQNDIVDLTRAMRSVIESHQNAATDAGPALARAAQARDDFAEVIRRLAPDNYSANIAIGLLGPAPAPAAAEPDHYLLRSVEWPGYWGRGKTIDEAARNAKWFRIGERVHIVRADAKAFFDDFGNLEYHGTRDRLGTGTLRKPGGKWAVTKIELPKT